MRNLFTTISPFVLLSIALTAQSVGKLCYDCIPSLPPDAALHEPALFSSLHTNIHRRQQLFQAPASSISSCLPFQPFGADPPLAVATQFINLRLSYLPAATLQVYNHI